MKVEIGPYSNWFGPHQLAEKICFWAKKNVADECGFKDYPDYVFKLGEWLAYGKWRGIDEIPSGRRNLFVNDDKPTWLYLLLERINNTNKRKVNIRIDKWDTWSMDTTLAKIVHPMLVQLKATKHGYPIGIDLEDVPENLRFIDKRNDYDYYDQQSLFDYQECNPEHISIEEERWNWVLNEMIYAFSILDDYENISTEHDRVENGCRLFGKYYRALWD